MSDPKTEKDQQTADSLSQTGNEAGIELNEKDLDNVAGGLVWKTSDKI